MIVNKIFQISKKGKIKTGVIFAVGFALTGSLLLLFVRAAVIGSFEVESGILGNGVSRVSDASASGGSAVRFASTSSNGERTCPEFPAFPDETCTGVPAGYSLQAIAGDFTTSSDSQVINGLDISGRLIVQHENVVVTNSRIQSRVTLNGHKGLSLTDVEVGKNTCPSSASTFEQISGSGYTLTRVYFHHNGTDPIRLLGGGKIVIRDSLVKNPCYFSGLHLDATQYYGPGSTGDVSITHSYLDVRPINDSGGFGNSAVFWSDAPGNGSRLTLRNNLFAGGNYAIYINDASAGTGTVIAVENNRWIRDSYRYGARNTSNSIPYDGTSGVIWSGNEYLDGGAIDL